MSRLRLLGRWIFDQFIYPVFAGLCAHDDGEEVVPGARNQAEEKGRG